MPRSGLLKAARLEQPKLKGQVVAVEAQEKAPEIVNRLIECARVPDEQEVRYLDGARQVLSWRELALPLEQPGSVAEVPWRDGGVYLITGGAGGLGLIFAEEIARRVKDAVVVLVGRSELDEGRRTRLLAIEGSGNRIEYRRVDVADSAAVATLIGALREAYGGVSGIIHAAGVIRDSFLLKKSVEEAAAVLAPKVLGVVNLDQATADLTLEFMILFGSGAGAFGNVGQSDYAAANAFLSSYAVWRNELVGRGERWGRTVSIAWPLWRDGGMQVDAAVARRHREAGVLPLETAGGLQAFYRALAAREAEIAVLSGELSLLRAHLADASGEQAGRQSETTIEPTDPRRLAEKTLHRLKGLLAEIAKLRVEQIDAREPLESYGIDSVMVMQLNTGLAGVFGELSKTLFFEYPTLEAVTEHLVAEQGSACARWTGLDQQQPAASTPKPIDSGRPVAVPLARRKAVRRRDGSAGLEREPIAIVGMSGRYPGAENLEQYWENLQSGADCIGELPLERWSAEGFYDPDPDQAASRGKSYSKRGGFLSGFAEFDPLFFNISPREAADIDPQERLFTGPGGPPLRAGAGAPRGCSGDREG